VARDYVAGFEGRLTDGAGMLVVGDVGVGKTHLACAIGNALLHRGNTVVYCTISEFFSFVKASWKSRDSEEIEVIQRFVEPDMLILDEIGVQSGSDWEDVQMTTLFDARSRQCRPVIGLSNLDINGVSDVLGVRSFDRLIGFGGRILEMRGRSLRVARLEIVK
jgi:DNA replication protein DnaC